MTTTPPEQQPPGAGTTGAGTRGTGGTFGGPSGGGLFGALPSDARLPIPGNAEFLLYLAALLIAALVCLVADRLDSAAWFDFFKWTTIAYLLSRGIAKASRVLEQ